MNPVERYATTPAQRAYLQVREIWTMAVVASLMSACAAVLLGMHVVTKGRSRRVGMDVVARGVSKRILALLDIDVDLRHVHDPNKPVVYLFNHSSTLDFFVVTALDLPRVRSFLSVSIRGFLPIRIMGEVLGHFFIPEQTDRPGRVACFQEATRVLRQTGDSIFVSPEGRRNIDGEISAFNKGAFHLAIELGRPIVPLFLFVPDEINPGMGYKTKPGTVIVEMGPEIDTQGWRLDEIERHRDEVRQMYVQWRAKFVETHKDQTE